MKAATKHPRLSWSRNPRATGLAAVGHTRGYTLKANDKRVATCTLGAEGWYWSAGWSYPDVPHQNSVFDDKYYDDPEDAKADAETYVRNALGMQPKATPKGEMCSGSGKTWIPGTGAPICPVCHRGPAAMKAPRPRRKDGRWTGKIPAHTPPRDAKAGS